MAKIEESSNKTTLDVEINRSKEIALKGKRIFKQVNKLLKRDHDVTK